MAPPLRALPLTARAQASRPGTPQRRNARHTTAALGSKVVRHLAGTVRLRGRESTPSGRTWLPWLPQGSTETWAHRQPNEDVPRRATRGVPGPHGQQR